MVVNFTFNESRDSDEMSYPLNYPCSDVLIDKAIYEKTELPPGVGVVNPDDIGLVLVLDVEPIDITL